MFMHLEEGGLIEFWQTLRFYLSHLLLLLNVNIVYNYERKVTSNSAKRKKKEKSSGGNINNTSCWKATVSSVSNSVYGGGGGEG